jgi:hypothetical protein
MLPVGQHVDLRLSEELRADADSTTGGDNLVSRHVLVEHPPHVGLSGLGLDVEDQDAGFRRVDRISPKWN